MVSRTLASYVRPGGRQSLLVRDLCDCSDASRIVQARLSICAGIVTQFVTRFSASSRRYMGRPELGASTSLARIKASRRL
jgi:hypothetical protein